MMQSVQVIIERLKTNPEDFFGDADHRGRIPKFVDITEKIDDLLADKDKQYVHRLWYLEPEEKEALIAAYKEARRARFEAQVFHTLLTPPEESQYDLNLATRKHPTTGKYMMPTGGVLTSQSMLNQAQQILEKEFDKEYAKNRNT